MELESAAQNHHPICGCAVIKRRRRWRATRSCIVLLLGATVALGWMSWPLAESLSLARFRRKSPSVVAWERAFAQEKPLQLQLSVVEHRWRVAKTSIGSTAAIAERNRAGLTVYVPVDTPLVLALKSEDYIYTLGVPELGLKEMAVPGLEFKLQLRPTQIGEFQLEGEEMCGEPGLPRFGRLVVESRDSFLQRLRSRSP